MSTNRQLIVTFKNQSVVVKGLDTLEFDTADESQNKASFDPNKPLKSQFASAKE